MIEEWASVIEFEGKYEVSNLGRVRSLTHTTKFLAKGNIVSSRVHKGRVLKFCSFGFYLGVCLSDGTNGLVKRYVHKLVGEHFIPNPSRKTQVNHKDLNKHNNCVDNLEWVTPKENMLHARASGAMPHVTLSRINPVDVLQIFNDKSPISDISRRTGFTHNTIYRLKTGRTWSHITNANN